MTGHSGRRTLDGRTAYSAVVFLRWVADNLAPIDKPYAAMLVDLANTLMRPPTIGCERCGGKLPTPSRTGRPRRFCTTCSPRKTGGKVHA